MAEPFKKQSVRYSDAAGKRCLPGEPGAIKHVEESKKWYGMVPQPDGRRKAIPLCTDLSKSRQMLNKLLADAAMASIGMGDPFAEYRKKPLVAHLGEWEADLLAQGCTADHAKFSGNRVRKVATACKFVYIADLSASRVQQYLAELRQGGLSIQTSNIYLQSVKQFCRWLVKDRRTADSPLAHLSGGNVRLDRRGDRRDLSRDELIVLLASVRQAPTMRGLSGIDREMLYMVALFTGLRASELASLTPSSFALDAETPSVKVEAAYSKHRREDVLPLHPDLAGRLRVWFVGKPLDGPLWPGKWASGKDAGVILKADLKRARASWIAAADDGDRKRREESSFLVYRDAAGKVADFHALRHTFISNLVRAGVSPKEAQTLARHSTITLTMDRYSHVGLHDIAGAVASLPPLPNPIVPAKSNLEPQPLRATGTDGSGCTQVAQTTARDCPPLSSTVPFDGGNGNGAALPQTLTMSSPDTPSHPQSTENARADGWIRTSMVRFTRSAPF